MARLTCPWCGKTHGRKSVTREKVTIDIALPVPLYRGNGLLVSEEIWPPIGADPAHEYVAMDDFTDRTFLGSIAPLRNGARVTLGEGCPDTYAGRKGRTIVRETWDGESYQGRYGAFCSMRCGLAFGQAALKAGYRVVAEEAAPDVEI